jgi:trk system potassium uptake protein TrkA
VRDQAGKSVIDVKDVMFMGGGNITIKTLKSLPKEIDVKIMEKEKMRVNHLIEKVDNAMIINADASDLDILKEENIEQMDAFVALSDNSEANILSCIAAKSFGLKKTIAEVENIDYIQLAESLDIGTIINKKMLAASYIYQYTLDADVHNVKCLTHVDAEVVELTAKEDSPITKGKIMDIKLPKDIFIGGVVREGKGFIANGHTEIQAGDDVIVFCLSSSFHKLDKLFN